LETKHEPWHEFSESYIKLCATDEVRHVFREPRGGT
jgi:hypothetical protein